MAAAGAAQLEEQIVGEPLSQEQQHHQVVYDEMGSPLDTNLVNKKRLKVFTKPTPALS